METRPVDTSLSFPQVGDRAPDFLIETPDGRVTLSTIAGRFEKLILISHDRYRYHPG